MAIDATSESRRSTSACIASSATGSVGGPRRTAGVVPAMCMSFARRGVPPPPPGDRSAAAPRRDDRRPCATGAWTSSLRTASAMRCTRRCSPIAVHAQRGIPHPVGSAQRPLPPHRDQTTPSLHRRRPRPHVRGAGTAGRPGPEDHHLHRRTRFPVPGGVEPAGELGGNGG